MDFPPNAVSDGGDGVIHMGLLSIIRRMALREKQSIREISRRIGLSRNMIATLWRREGEPDQFPVLTRMLAMHAANWLWPHFVLLGRRLMNRAPACSHPSMGSRRCAVGNMSIELNFIDIISRHVDAIDISPGHVVQTRIKRHETTPGSALQRPPASASQG